MLEVTISGYKTKESGTLKFLLGAVIALISIVFFLLLFPSKPNAYKIYEVKEIIPIFRFILCIIFTLL